MKNKNIAWKVLRILFSALKTKIYKYKYYTPMLKHAMQNMKSQKNGYVMCCHTMQDNICRMFFKMIKIFISDVPWNKLYWKQVYLSMIYIWSLGWHWLRGLHLSMDINQRIVFIISETYFIWRIRLWPFF